MTADLLASFVLFAIVTSVTPGPNNIMLTASGLSFGFRRTIPHMLGIATGFTVMVAAIGLGLGEIFALWPFTYTALKYAGAAYLLTLARNLARSGPVGEGKAAGSPLTFWQAAAFQWVNPKAWVMAVGAIATYTPQTGYFANLVIVSLVFGIVNLPCVSLWAVFGAALRGLLRAPRAVRIFNVTMALLLVASLYPVARDLFN